MALLTLRQIFGSSATQDATTITFLKSELRGLTPSTVNSADAIFAAIINNTNYHYQGILTDENGNRVTDENGTIIDYDNHSYYSNTWVLFWGYLLSSNNTRLNTIFIFSEVQHYED